jgi:cobalt-zinc-cadmium efflux system membrane fusion protein
MNRTILRAIAPAAAALAFAGCGPSPDPAPSANAVAGEDREKASGDPTVVTLSAQQIADAGIEVTRPTVGGVTGAIELPATIEGDPQGVQVVAAPIGGRLVSLTRNHGQPIGRDHREPRGSVAQCRGRSGRCAVRACPVEPTPRTAVVR